MAPFTPKNNAREPADDTIGTTHSTPILPPILPHQPTLRLHLNALTHPATTLFLTTIDTAHLIPNAITHILRHLYTPHGAHHIPHIRSVTLVLRSMGGVAYTTGLDLDPYHKEIHLSLEYLSQRLKEPTAFREETLGVVTHEMVHCYQHNCQGSAPGGLIEGMADYVRLKAGLGAKHWRKGGTEEERGKKWDEGYQKTAWFLEWLDGKYGEGTVSRVNAAMREGDYEEEQFWEGLFGVSVQEMWKMYRRSWEKDEDDGEAGVVSGAGSEAEMVELTAQDKEEAEGILSSA